MPDPLNELRDQIARAVALHAVSGWDAEFEQDGFNQNVWPLIRETLAGAWDQGHDAAFCNDCEWHRLKTEGPAKNPYVRRVLSCMVWHDLYGCCELSYGHEGFHSRVPGGAAEANTWAEGNCQCGPCRDSRKPPLI